MSKFANKMVKIFLPKTIEDIENIAGILLESEVSILVNMKECQADKEALLKILGFIYNCRDSKMAINIKKMYSNVFICWSKPLKK